jgi:hypothetical protein
MLVGIFMTVTLRSIENEPILIAEFTPPLDMYVDIHALKEAVYHLYARYHKVLHLVIDSRKTSVSLREAMMGAAQSQTAPKSLRDVPIYVYTIVDVNNKVWQFVRELGQKGLYGGNFHFDLVNSEAEALERIAHFTANNSAT